MEKCRRVKYDYSKLKGRINEKKLTLTDVANRIGITIQSFSKKLNGEVDFKTTEIDKLMNILQISKREIDIYFFEEEVK